jgi:serine/threonine protein kinase
VTEPLRSVGNYVLGAQLGRGATSEVFAAEHRFLGDRAAIKLLRAELAGDGAAAEELVAEAAKLRAVRHRNVVRVLDAGADPASGRCYLVMERVEGESLAARLERETQLPEAEARRLGAAIADGLAAVHAAGLVHRDLKPANVMLDGGEPKLVDFGIAKLVGGDAAMATSRRVGTPAYMAPEQIAGGLIAPCVDVWALGVLLFEAVTGRLPFEGFEGGRCPQLVEVAPRAGALAPVSPALERLIGSCLERDPGRRPPSMEAVARGLRGEGGAGGELGEPGGERITEDAGPLLPALPSSSSPAVSMARALLSPPPSAPGVSMAPRWRRWLIIGAAGVLASGIGIGAAMLVIGSRDAATPAPVASAEPPQSKPSAQPAESQPTEPTQPTETQPTETQTQPKPTQPAEPPQPTEPAGPTQPQPTQPSQSRPSSSTAGTGAGAAGAASQRKQPRAALSVDVRSSPAGAQIFADGKLLGTTPRRLELAAPATLTLRYQGYQPARVRAAKPGPIDVRLQRSCAHPPCEDLN